jgi:hypothetical protein
MTPASITASPAGYRRPHPVNEQLQQTDHAGVENLDRLAADA